jgi:hypothetical protein
MEHDNSILPPLKRTPWNKGKLIGPKAPQLARHVWSIRTKLQRKASPRVGGLNPRVRGAQHSPTARLEVQRVPRSVQRPRRDIQPGLDCSRAPRVRSKLSSYAKSRNQIQKGHYLRACPACDGTGEGGLIPWADRARNRAVGARAYPQSSEFFFHVDGTAVSSLGLAWINLNPSVSGSAVQPAGQ